ncbi:hypothetical protein ElyMa_001389100 [Elysia marginata]|uniref:Uncharacterized protein n=1 Tax=Elysia marginata TaxID=1093978 RepID=A0AAV4ITZ6_9GAST|nr:hypothetical protein ElyMa_001389100 [Elysia marginata]
MDQMNNRLAAKKRKKITRKAKKGWRDDIDLVQMKGITWGRGGRLRDEWRRDEEDYILQWMDRASCQASEEQSMNTTVTGKRCKESRGLKIVESVSYNARHRVSVVVHRLCGLAVRHSLRDREVRGSILGRVKPRTFNMVLAADPPSVWHYGRSAKSGRPGVRIM